MQVERWKAWHGYRNRIVHFVTIARSKLLLDVSISFIHHGGPVRITPERP